MGGVVFSASPATEIVIPTGGIAIESQDTVTIPDGVTVIKVSHYDLGVVYVGVIPNTKHTLVLDWDMIRPGYYRTYIECLSHNLKYLRDIITTEYDDQEPDPNFEVRWSPEINKQTPTITDY